MKRYKLLGILKRLKRSSPLKYKYKLFIGLGIAGFVVTFALVLWIGLSGMRYVAGLAEAADVNSSVETLRSEFQRIPALTTGCWETARSFLSIEPWVQKPILENFEDLKAACLKPKDLCEEGDCDNLASTMEQSVSLSYPNSVLSS